MGSTGKVLWACQVRRDHGAGDCGVAREEDLTLYRITTGPRIDIPTTIKMTATKNPPSAAAIRGYHADESCVVEVCSA